MRLVTLDLSSHVGWTIGPADGAFRSGTEHLPQTGDNVGLFAQAYNIWLEAMLDGVDMLVFEAPILHNKSGLKSVRKLTGLAWHTEFLCSLRGVTVLEAANTSVKKFITGYGGAKKPEVLEAVRRYGYDIDDFDEADAIALRLYTIARKFPNLAERFGLQLGQLGASALQDTHAAAS